MRHALYAVAAVALAPFGAFAEAHGGDAITADIVGADGATIGSIKVMATPSGMNHITVTAEGIEPGVHGIHLHETGLCEGDFSSAGGHIAGDAEHGVHMEGGPHPGDLPNAHVQEDGMLAVEVFSGEFDIAEHLMDADGSAFIIHAGADDYESQPSGDAGGRVGCAVLAPAS